MKGNTPAEFSGRFPGRIDPKSAVLCGGLWLDENLDSLLSQTFTTRLVFEVKHASLKSAHQKNMQLDTL